MKSVKELTALRDKYKTEYNLGDDAVKTRVLVGYATCGIAAGASPVLEAFQKAAEEDAELKNVMIIPTGCVGVCKLEPVVEIVAPGSEKVTYVKMTAEKALKIIEEHLKKGNVVTEYTIGAAQ